MTSQSGTSPLEETYRAYTFHDLASFDRQRLRQLMAMNGLDVIKPDVQMRWELQEIFFKKVDKASHEGLEEMMRESPLYADTGFKKGDEQIRTELLTWFRKIREPNQVRIGGLSKSVEPTVSGSDGQTMKDWKASRN